MLTVKKTEVPTEAAVLDAPGLSLPLTFDCGQSFRFEPVTDRTGYFEGVAYGRYLLVSAEEEKLFLHGIPPEDAELWQKYFSLDRDWEAIRQDVAARAPVLSRAAEVAGGIRILRQEPFEALITFVLSQCNNISRIKGLVLRLSAQYGSPIYLPDGRVLHAFPDSETLSSVPIGELRALKLGYRAEFVHAAANAACNGLLDEVEKEPNTQAASLLLTAVPGIGEKVAACVLLFGFGRLDAFPRDVWIKKAMQRYFPGGNNPAVFGPYAGVAQQYLFYLERYLNGSSAKQ